MLDSLDEFKRKVIRRLIQITALLLLVLIYGTVGFYVIEETSLFDAFYMAVITMTTVGYGEVIPLSIEGRFFAITAIFSGLVGSGISIAIITNLLLEESMLDLLKGSKMTQKLAGMKNHFIVCGCGSTGLSIIEELVAHKEAVVVINLEETELPEGCILIVGDARQDDILVKARIHDAKGLATTLTEDADNVFVTLTARSLNEKLRIVSRFKDEDSEKKLLIAGADQAISPYRMGGQRLALSLANPGFQKILDATFKNTDLDVQFAHVAIPDGCFIRSQSLKESAIDKHSLGALIVAVEEKRGATIFNPDPDLRLDNAEQLLVLGDHEQIKAIQMFINGGPGAN